jgi:hypothetical protein
MRIVHTALPLFIWLSRQIGFDNDLVCFSAERAFEESHFVLVVDRLVRNQRELTPANCAPTVQPHW